MLALSTGLLTRCQLTGLFLLNLAEQSTLAHYAAYNTIVLESCLNCQQNAQKSTNRPSCQVFWLVLIVANA